MALNDLDMGGAPFTRDALPGMAVCGPIENLSYLPLDYVGLIVAFGQTAAQMLGIAAGDIEGLPVWFEFDDPDAECPLSLTEPKETWRTWGQGAPNDQPVQKAGKWYRSSADFSLSTNSGSYIDASRWTGLRAAAQLVVLTNAEYQAIPPDNPPEPPSP